MVTRDHLSLSDKTHSALDVHTPWFRRGHGGNHMFFLMVGVDKFGHVLALILSFRRHQ
jgi:hypothetical protein